jgi:hypothetical protein
VAVVGAYSARWDLERGRILILRGGNGGGLEALLLQFTDENSRGDMHP